MAYVLKFQDIGKVLFVEISGEREKEELIKSAMEVWREIARVTQEMQVVKILVVSSATGSYPALDAFLINSKLDECGVKRNWKIAFVNLDQNSFPDVKFAETVAVNRGFNLGVFKNESHAKKWLLKHS